jgi:uncharacterized membrane protein YkvA (DUF1232 family)
MARHNPPGTAGPMKPFHKILLVLFGLIYLISQVDLIPEVLVPFLGWVDDGVILYAVYHLIRYNRLPWNFFFKKRNKP